VTVYLGATAEHREGIAAIGAREDANGANRQHKQTYSRRGVRPSSSQHGVPNCRRGSTLNSPTAESELTFANAVHQLDAGDRDCCVPEVLEAQHHSDALLHAPMVLPDQVVQVLRRPQFRARGQQASGFQLAHCSVRGGVAVQCDRLRGAALAFDRFAKERLGGRDIAPDAQPEVDRPARPINGTIEVTPLASILTYVSSTRHDRPTARANRCQRFSNSGA